MKYSEPHGKLSVKINEYFFSFIPGTFFTLASIDKESTFPPMVNVIT